MLIYNTYVESLTLEYGIISREKLETRTGWKEIAIEHEMNEEKKAWRRHNLNIIVSHDIGSFWK